MTNKIMATFHPQVWRDDYAIPADAEGDVEFDVTDVILAMTFGEVIEMCDNSDASDKLRSAPNAPDWIKNWSGPFYIEVMEKIEQFATEEILY